MERPDWLVYCRPFPPELTDKICWKLQPFDSIPIDVYVFATNYLIAFSRMYTTRRVNISLSLRSRRTQNKREGL